MTRPAPRAILFQHDVPVSAGALEGALARAGFVLETRFREVRPGDANADLVVVLGGFMGVYEADQHPYLREELALMERRLHERRPCLGICLGAQMLAAISGARVYQDPKGMVLGAQPIHVTAAGHAHPVFAGAPASLLVPQWHGDTFDTVRGAESLAGSERQPQEVFLLSNSVGFLFHPEVEPHTLESWVRSFPEALTRSGRTLDDVLARDLPALQAARAESEGLLRRVSEHFAREVSRA
ncbi:type 1 glutamine amidotransferase [Pyxidicoccus fallax]|uniref:Type 1 glutamine amidotransferase n=1 Tax=Pyxidicoccus fallax TaxID=394095 RepID=A0A848LGM2_9BACT|nr:type 1 glutamine amidotransferase [Pyxidicoccus fallax]NMO16763.1 type 1 glutamine amidotransferase [Pyxidicoccus fallax]NPC77844.1 type 1 glutamine amidotransferase [Pyxidicoccus fallax]